MQEFSFRQGNATIRHLKEMPAPKKKINIDRLLFVILLALVAVYAIFRLYKGLAIIEINGMVTMEKLDVHFTDDIRVNELFVEEGATIAEGDTLFRYTNQYFENDAASYMNIVSNKERIDREVIDIRRRLLEKTSERTILQKRLQEQRFDLQTTRQLVSLAAVSKTEFDNQERDIASTEDKLELIRREVQFMNIQIDQLNGLKGEYSNMAGINGSAFQSRYYVALKEGLIGQIGVENNEVCYKGDEVLTIHQPRLVKVQAFFNQSEADEIEIGRTVTIQFPDGTKQKGSIDRFYVSTYELPPEFQKKYEPTTRSILVDIVPLNESDVRNWQQFYKMNVQVKLQRYGN